MMKIISLVLQLVFVAGGVALGLAMKSPKPAETQESTEEDKKDSAKPNKNKDEKKSSSKKKKKADNDKKDKKSKDGKGSDTTYGFLKFSRQFIVPIVTAGNVDTLLIIDINLEVKPAATESAYSQEPKLRDALLTALLRLSNEGAFDEKMLEDENIEDVREQLLYSAREIIGDDVLEVLILSMARQEL